MDRTLDTLERAWAGESVTGDPLPVGPPAASVGPAAGVRLIAWFMTTHRSINVRWKMLRRMAGWLALIGLVLPVVVGWLVSLFAAPLAQGNREGGACHHRLSSRPVSRRPGWLGV